MKNAKNSEKRSESFQLLSGRLKIFHRHFSKSFSPPKICTKKKPFSPRDSAGVATLRRVGAKNFGMSFETQGDHPESCANFLPLQIYIVAHCFPLFVPSFLADTAKSMLNIDVWRGHRHIYPVQCYSLGPGWINSGYPQDLRAQRLKIQDRPPGLKFSISKRAARQTLIFVEIKIENFKRD